MTNELRSALETAGFWEEVVCLECGTTQQGGFFECSSCGSRHLVTALIALGFLALMEDDGEPTDD